MRRPGQTDPTAPCQLAAAGSPTAPTAAPARAGQQALGCRRNPVTGGPGSTGPQHPQVTSVETRWPLVTGKCTAAVLCGGKSDCPKKRFLWTEGSSLQLARLKTPPQTRLRTNACSCPIPRCILGMHTATWMHTATLRAAVLTAQTAAPLTGASTQRPRRATAHGHEPEEPSGCQVPAHTSLQTDRHGQELRTFPPLLS